MKLYELLKNIKYETFQGGDADIKGLCYDSRKAVQGGLFVCIKGFKTDGHQYVSEALKKDIAAIVCEDTVCAPENVSVIKVENSRTALSEIANAFYNDPSAKLKIIGITGTNGKTSTAYLLDSILRENGEKTGIIGTIENRIGDEVFPAERTTPEAPELAKMFSKMLESGVTTVTMEVSSHSLDLHRVDFCKFDVGVFTNLSQDHLDYHKTMENYLQAKARLFSMCRYGAVNGDDPRSGNISGTCEFITYGLGVKNDLRAEIVSLNTGGSTFTVNIYGEPTEIKLPLLGKFSVYNALGAIAAATLLKIPTKAIKNGLEKSGVIPGRAQSVKAGSYNIIVDYAHTPDGLANILDSIRGFAEKRVITVFGCGGDRDKEKRPLMGEIAGEKSDFAIITSDNPRDEDPDSIIEEIEQGIMKTRCDYVKITDRGEAIEYAVKTAKEGDVILLAGKGHETYQIFADRTIEFDDAKWAKNAVKHLEEI